MKKKIGLSLVALLCIGTVVGLLQGCSDGDSEGSDAGFTEVALFKDEAGNRINIFELAAGVSAQGVREYAEGLAFSAGFLTAAYFYPQGAIIPLHSVSLASGVEQANGAIYKARGFSPWQYAFVRTPEGEVQFVDCQESPKGELCRKQ